jgi:hypothetical protein
MRGKRDLSGCSQKDALMNVELLGGFGDTLSRTIKKLCEKFCKPEAQDTISSIIAFDGVCGTAWKCLYFLISSDLFGPDGDGNARYSCVYRSSVFQRNGC